MISIFAYGIIGLMFLAGTMNVLASMYFDSSPPLTVHNAKLLTPVVEQGGRVDYIAHYDKRIDCTPPQGEGNVYYRYEGAISKSDGSGTVIRDRVAGRLSDTWPAGKGLKGEGSVLVPSDLPEGSYELSATIVYSCSRALMPIKVTTPSMPVLVQKKPDAKAASLEPPAISSKADKVIEVPKRRAWVATTVRNVER